MKVAPALLGRHLAGAVVGFESARVGQLVGQVVDPGVDLAFRDLARILEEFGEFLRILSQEANAEVYSGSTMLTLPLRPRVSDHAQEPTGSGQ